MYIPQKIFCVPKCATKPNKATPSDFKVKLNNVKCEWYVRPGIAASELHETLDAN